MKPFTCFLLFIFCLTVSFSLATRTPSSLESFSSALQNANVNRNNKDSGSGGGGSNGGDDTGGFSGPGGGLTIPGFENGFGNGITGGGFGVGYGGPNGGYSKGGLMSPTVVCKEKGPCYQKKLRCPSKCFTSFSSTGKGYGGGGGGGGCTIDCKKKCIASC